MYLKDFLNRPLGSRKTHAECEKLQFHVPNEKSLSWAVGSITPSFPALDHQCSPKLFPQWLSPLNWDDKLKISLLQKKKTAQRLMIMGDRWILASIWFTEGPSGSWTHLGHFLQFLACNWTSQAESMSKSSWSSCWLSDLGVKQKPCQRGAL